MYSETKLSIRRFREFTPRLDKGVYIDPTSTVIGNVQLGAEVSVWPLVAIRGDVNHIHIGARTNIQDGTVIHVSRRTQSNPGGHATVIGEDTTVGHKVMLHGCTIGNRVLVGMGAIVLDGVVVEDDVMIGAGALVTPGKRLRSGYLYTGSPARETRKLRDEELNSFKQTADKYIELKADYINELNASDD